jgi:hypothetical protein
MVGQQEYGFHSQPAPCPVPIREASSATLCTPCCTTLGINGGYFCFNMSSVVSHHSLPFGSRRINGCLPRNFWAAARKSSLDSNRWVAQNAPVVELLGVSFHWFML